MTNQATIDKLIEMRFTAMADAFRQEGPGVWAGGEEGGDGE